MPSTVVCTGKATFKKQSGILQLTDSHITWTQDGKVSPSLKIPTSDAASLFCSKVGATQVKLKLVLTSYPEGHTFTFTAPPPTATVEREAFKTEITNHISRNRNVQNVQVLALPTAVTPSLTPSATPAPGTPFGAPTPRLVPPLAGASPRTISAASDSRASSTSANDVTGDYRLRKRVLLSSPELAALHRELVMTGQITENEFWDGREHLLLAQAATETQRKGKSGQLVDPRPQTVDGEIKIVITPQLVHDIFEEYPVVATAYNDNVPGKLSEGEFWKRYFQSKLFHAHRASIRSSATQHVVKEDPIFDKYLVKDDDELEPRKKRVDKVDTLVDLGATDQDHGETGNEKDTTMQAGRQKAALPLIRRFNEHSERLLNSALGEGPATKRRRVDESASSDPWNYYSQIDIEDLHDPEAPTGITLDMQDSRRYFESRVANEQSSHSRQPIDIKASFHAIHDNLQDWERNLTQIKLDRKAGESALSSMTSNVKSRLDVRIKKKDIPESFMRQMSTCQTAANEFLRQFWSSVYPSPSQLSVPLTESVKNQRAAKAAKMIGYLAGTRDKVAALVRAAPQERVDPKRVETAMKPVLDAVDKALAFHRTRTPKAPPLR